jgi:hypothetical protein
MTSSIPSHTNQIANPDTKAAPITAKVPVISKHYNDRINSATNLI